MKPFGKIVFLLAFSLALAACGKKGDLEPPERHSVAFEAHLPGK